MALTEEQKRKYRLLTGKEPPKEKKEQGLLASLLSPITNAVKTITKYTKEGIPPASQQGIGQILPSGRFLKDTAKTGAGLASFATPFGKGAGFLQKALLPGGAVGGLYGVSDERKSNPLVDVLAGGATAGAFRGATNTLGFAGRKLTQDLPKGLMGGVLTETAKTARSAIKKGTELGKLALQKGVRGTPENIYKTALSKLESFENELQGKLTGNIRGIPLADIQKDLNPFIKKFRDAGNATAVENVQGRIDALATQHKNIIPINVANEVKRTLYDEIRESSYGQVAMPGKEGLKQIARSLKEGIAKRIKGANEINQELSAWGRIADASEKAILKGSKGPGVMDVGFGAAGAAASVLTGSPLPLLTPLAITGAKSPTLRTNLAQFLNTAGKVRGENVQSGILDQLLGQIGGRTGSIFGVNQTPASVDQTDYSKAPSPQVTHGGTISQGITDVNTTGQKDPYTLDDGQTSPDGQWKYNAAKDDWEPNEGGIGELPFTEAQLKTAMAEAVVSGNKKQFDLLKSARDELYGKEEEVQLSDTAIKNISDIQSGIEDVTLLQEDLEAEGKQTYPGRGIIAKLPFAENAKIMQARINRIKQSVGKALEGGVLRKEDEAKYKEILATINDPEKVSLDKAAQLERKLKADLKRYVDLQKQFGKGRVLENLSGSTTSLYGTE